MGKYRRTLSVPTSNPESPRPLLCALTTIWHLLFQRGDVIQSRESGNGEAACRYVENYPAVLFWDLSTWKVSLGIALLLFFWPCKNPFQLSTEGFSEL